MKYQNQRILYGRRPLRPTGEHVEGLASPPKFTRLKLIQLHKQYENQILVNCTLIAFLSHVLKIIEHMLYVHLKQHYRLSQTQFGFSPHDSIEMAITKTQRLHRDVHKCVVILCLKAPYDSVARDCILAFLKQKVPQ